MMLDLTSKALARLKSGGQKPADEDKPNPFRDAMEEAFKAVESKDFDRFHSAFESAMDIRLADREMQQEVDSGDAEPWELNDLERQ